MILTATQIEHVGKLLGAECWSRVGSCVPVVVITRATHRAFLGLPC